VRRGALDARRPSSGETDDGLEEGADSGFTLIELMVVLLIMAILMAIAIPTFLGVRSGAEDRSAQSDLTNAVIGLKALFVTDGKFATNPSLVAELQGSEPELNFVAVNTVTTSPAHAISIQISIDGNMVVVADESADARCWYAEVNEELITPPLPAAPFYATTALGVSYAGTQKGLAGVSLCGVQDNYIRTGPGPTSIFSGWGATYPS